MLDRKISSYSSTNSNLIKKNSIQEKVHMENGPYFTQKLTAKGTKKSGNKEIKNKRVVIVVLFWSYLNLS